MRCPQPFFVIATQNPLHQAGTFPLPESQLDRFLMRIGLGYPGEALERKLLKGDDRRSLLGEINPVIDVAGLVRTAEALRGSCSCPTPCSTTCRPWSASRASRPSSISACPRAAPRTWSARRAAGRCFTGIPACIRKT